MSIAQKIETGAKTLKELAEAILTLDEEVQNRRVYVADSEYGDEPWHGVIIAYDEERYDAREGVTEIVQAHVVISDVWTDAEFEAVQAKAAEDASQRRREHWNHPEVQEAKEKGLLP